MKTYRKYGLLFEQAMLKTDPKLSQQDRKGQAFLMVMEGIQNDVIVQNQDDRTEHPTVLPVRVVRDPEVAGRWHSVS